ncbi:efflux RND transporter periplasmic adaptor subunit [Hyphomicrobium sp. MC1]|uniref:efflux RND transporter periplasmic adaptor subunit n=1 Tax=Hyphomicrobium sp. (strain MC1) TaxID=717785 RepID=UPI000213EAFA|nr:efflux RND transporter periplasmic adaptor subunit [Hyphomicrobium sp. MC1]CCB64749.1 putative RND efflux transporter, MFP subunit [Hyphomicrobium sp. MC1]
MQRMLIAGGGRLCAAALALAVLCAATFAPGLSRFFTISSDAKAHAPAETKGHSESGHQHDEGHAHDAGGEAVNEENGSDAAHGEEAGHEHHEGLEVSQDRIDAEGIALTEAGAGVLDRSLTVPGTVIADRNRVGRVAAQVVGTVAELKKRLGDVVAKNEVVAILDSREVADAKSEYINALVNANLQETLFDREKTLYEKQISAEQRYLRAQATDTEAKVRRGLAHQKLAALGVSELDIQTLKQRGQSATNLQRYEIRAPIGGRIVEQLVDLGTPVGREGEAKELYAIADLSVVWIELAVSISHLPDIKEGQSVLVSGSQPAETTSGKIIFTSPMINEETRTARVIASVENKDLALRPGSFVNADILFGTKPVGLKLPKTALQTVKGETIVYVRTEHGFAARKVTVGGTDGSSVEIVAGIEPGETVAATNTFLLKAESGKSEATHSH